jgi:hypothetical protein
VLTVALTGGFDAQVLRLAAVAIPVTLLFTWLGRAFRPPLGDVATRRAAFALLLASGALIIVDALGVLR